MCSETGPCFVGRPCNESLCESFSRWTVENTDSSCKVNSYTDGLNALNGSVIASGCEMLDRPEGYTDSLKSLREIQLSYGAFFVMSVLLTIYYLAKLYGKFKARISLIPEVMADVHVVRDKLDKPYFAPPAEDFPGRPAAPYYRPEAAAAKVEKKASLGASGDAAAPTVVVPSCRGCQLRDEAREIYCRICGAAYDDNGIGQRQRQQQALVMKEASRRRLYQEYLKNFISTAGVRFLCLTLEQMPQAIIIIMYVVAIDKPDGLYCMECSTEGDLCDFGTSYPRLAVFLVLVGQLASVGLLCVQVLYLKGLENKERKRAYSV